MNNRVASLAKLSSGDWTVFYHTDTTPMKAGNSGTFSALHLAQHAQVRWIEDGVMCFDA